MLLDIVHGHYTICVVITRLEREGTIPQTLVQQIGSNHSIGRLRITYLPHLVKLFKLWVFGNLSVYRGMYYSV